MRSRHIEHIALSGAHSVLREGSLSLFLASRVSLHGRRGPPSGEGAGCPEKPSEPVGDPGQGRAGRPGPPILQAVLDFLRGHESRSLERSLGSPCPDSPSEAVPDLPTLPGLPDLPGPSCRLPWNPAAIPPHRCQAGFWLLGTTSSDTLASRAPVSGRLRGAGSPGAQPTPGPGGLRSQGQSVQSGTEAGLWDALASPFRASACSSWDPRRRLGRACVSILQMGTNEAQGAQGRVRWGTWELVSGLRVLCTARGETGLRSPSSPEDSDFSLVCQRLARPA